MIKLVLFFWCLILTLITSLFNIGTVKFSKTEYIISYGGTTKIEYVIIGDTDLSFNVKNSSIASVNNDGVVQGLKVGITEVIASFNNENINIKIYVKEKNGINNNSYMSKFYYFSLLTNEIIEYQTKNIFKNGEIVTINVNVDSSLISKSLTIKEKILEDYIELEYSNDDNKYVYTKMYNHYMEYIIASNDEVSRNIISSEKFNGLKLINKSGNNQFDINDFNINKTDSSYYIEIYYKDLVKYEQFDKLDEVIESYGLSSNSLNDSIIYFRIEVTTTGINIDMSMTTSLTLIFFKMPVFININMNLSKDNVKKMKFE